MRVSIFKSVFLFIIFFLANLTTLQASSNCANEGVWLQVLGSGGPEINDGRASSGYLIWHNGKARILIDMGAGSLFHFEQSGASLNDLDVILMSHFHVDHSNDLPALIKASFFTARNRDLLLYGPGGNRLMPSATKFVRTLFGKNGAFKYLNSYLDGSERYQLLAYNVDTNIKNKKEVIANSSYRITALPVHHGPIPSLAWSVEIEGKKLVFSGDMNNDNHTLFSLAKNAALFVAHHAVPEEAKGIARNLHMPPSEIGKIAAKAKVKQLLLSHRMNRTLGRENISTDFIRQAYKGPLYFADDLQCFQAK